MNLCIKCGKSISGGSGGMSMGVGSDFLKSVLERHIYRCETCGAVYCGDCGLNNEWKCGKCNGKICD